MNNSLLFFNKEGYPYNFQYNKEDEKWEGKILFDENSNQTFKTQSIYVFENVEPIELSINADLINNEYFNDSGLTIQGETNFKIEEITNITKVNNSVNFYSKWIHGENFDKKFPVGTVISFSNIDAFSTYLSDFDENKYFTVLNVKKNAFLIITETNNNIFDINFISGKTSSLNMISIKDFNRNLSNVSFFQNLYTDKTFSIIDSQNNDRLVSVKQSGVTTSYINDIKISGNQNDIFKLKINLLTERPKIFRNDVYVTNDKILHVGRYAKYLTPTITYDSNGNQKLTKKEIIFEDNNGTPLFNGYNIVVDSLIDEKDLGVKNLKFKIYYKDSQNYTYNSKLKNYTQWNTIQFSGQTTDLKKGDIISLTSDSSTALNVGEYSINDVIYNSTSGVTILFTLGNIVDDINYYTINKKLQPHQITSVNVTNDLSAFNNILYSNSFCYETTTEISLFQDYLTETTTNGVTNSIAKNTITSFINKHKPILYQYGIDIYHTEKNNDDYLSVESLYSSSSLYFTVSGYTNGVKIIDDFSLGTNGETDCYNILTNEKLYNENTNRSDKLLYKNDINTEIVFDLNANIDKFGFRLTLNGIEYFINFITDTENTINAFIDKYKDIMLKNGFILSIGYISGKYSLKISSDIDIWDIDILVNELSSSEIISYDRNRYLFLSGNEIKTTYTNLFDIGLATGMILKISGSEYNTNNTEYNIISLTNNRIGLSYQGKFVNESSVDIYGKTREFLRKPRGDYNKDIYLRAYWDVPYDDYIDESIFFYDISGNQLKPFNNNNQYEYKGIKPLIDIETNNMVLLNKKPNDDITQVKNPKVQQTVFDELIFKLDQLDTNIYNWTPEPLEIFIGYNSEIEGVNTRTLKLEIIEKFENNENYLSYSGYTNSGVSLSFDNFMFEDDTIYYNSPVDFNFSTYGFEKDQIIRCYFKDQSKFNQRIFENNYKYKIKKITRNKIIIDTDYYYDVKNIDSGYTYSPGKFTYFTTTGTTFYFNIEVQPKEILHCPLYGQTESEDLRYKVNLNNLGIKSENDVYEILYESDIQDNGIDYTLFNRKRKQMLSSFGEIYNYIGSYKSLVNAIQYFGYNDLQLFEYYRNIDKSSYLYEKLHKILIPDIFDNSIEGWNEIDFISGKYQDQTTWKKTNLFNLSYRITDEDGNNVLIYSLEEVQYKLTKLKNWLRQNIIPISANLVDITGLSETKLTQYQDYDESNQTLKYVVERNSTVVNFNYTTTLNFDDNYLITVNFYTLSGATGTTIDNNNIPVSFSAKIKTFYLSGCTDGGNQLIPVQYFKLNKTDLKPFSFNLNKNTDPYIYIETTTYDNDGNGLGYVNNKIFYFDEPRNHWLVTHNFDLNKMKYWQADDFINNDYNRWVPNMSQQSTIVGSPIETIVNTTDNNKYFSKINNDNNG